MQSMNFGYKILANIKSLISNPTINDSLVNIPASLFLRPYNKNFKTLELKKINRIKKGMLDAAINQKVFHLWWHPHNFGQNLNQNLNNLEQILIHYTQLRNKYNMSSTSMKNL